MEGEEDVDREGSDVENEGGDEGGDQAKQEYVKKEFVCRPLFKPHHRGRGQVTYYQEFKVSLAYNHMLTAKIITKLFAKNGNSDIAVIMANMFMNKWAVVNIVKNALLTVSKYI